MSTVPSLKNNDFGIPESPDIENDRQRPSASPAHDEHVETGSDKVDFDQHVPVDHLSEVTDSKALEHALGGLSGEEIEHLRAHFDESWYLDSFPDADAGSDPFVHYMTTGWRELEDPSAHFSTASYLDRYPDVRKNGINPFRHWVLFGIREGRSGEREPSFPLSRWDGLTAGAQAILARMFSVDHYYSHLAGTGLQRGRSVAAHVASGHAGNQVTPSFRTARYVAALTKAIDARQIPFLHFLFDMVGEEALRGLFLDYSPTQIQGIAEHFDTAWYLYSYPDVEAAGYDAFIHYMTIGWRERRDPSPNFSTSAYLLRYMDIVRCGMNPFLHWVIWGRSEGRLGASFSKNFRDRPYAPSVTAILVGTASDPIRPDCLAGVLAQSYRDLTVLIVGDPPCDACGAILADAAYVGGGKIVRDLTDDHPSSRLALLERAVGAAAGDLVWFIEGPGVHHDEFLARLTSSFADGSVQLGFGREVPPDERLVRQDMPARMAGWNRHVTSPAATWFPGQLRPETLAAPRHGFVWRRRTLGREVWSRAGDYASLGHWHLYLHMASGGQIASVRDAHVYFPSAPEPLLPLPDDIGFHRDAARFAAEVRSFWGATRNVGEDAAPASDAGRTWRHILLVTHGIFAGGAENFPIQLANALAERGIIVSMLIFKTDDVNPEMRATLDPGVSIYEAEWAMGHGCDAFVRDIGCTLIHSHGIVGEMFFFERCDIVLPVPYVATLHGSYEASTSEELPERVLAKLVRRVDLFVYTADKNLKPLLRHDVRPERLVKMINAMPIDEAPFPFSREELGIAPGAVVFTLVARGIPEKGWSVAIDAFQAVRAKNPHRAVHLCLVGEGDETERMKLLHADDPGISFLGFQLRIHGLYRMTDVAVVPTRFAGESFPLCIIQALQVAVPVIATDVGEIASMLRAGDATGGVVVGNSPVDARFAADVADAMHALMDDERRKRLGATAAMLGAGYDMSGLTDRYVDLYEDVTRRFAATRSVSYPRGPGFGATAV